MQKAAALSCDGFWACGTPQVGYIEHTPNPEKYAISLRKSQFE
jgi:hypothetical protein